MEFWEEGEGGGGGSCILKAFNLTRNGLLYKYFHRILLRFIIISQDLLTFFPEHLSVCSFQPLQSVLKIFIPARVLYAASATMSWENIKTVNVSEWFTLYSVLKTKGKLQESFKTVYTNVVETLENLWNKQDNGIKLITCKSISSYSSSVFFVYQCHADFLFYVILRNISNSENSNQIISKILTNLLQSFLFSILFLKKGG